MNTFRTPLRLLLLAASAGAFATAAWAQSDASAPPAATAPAPAADAPADPDAYFKGKMGGTFGKDIIEVLPAGKRVAVPAFRLAFITDNSVTAQVRGAYLPGGIDRSGARSSMFVALKGVDPKTMQAITDRAYADLLAQIKASGREVVPAEEMKEFFASIQATPTDAAKPYSKAQNGQTAAFFAPTGMPLVFMHLDQGWGDRSAFDIGNYRRLEEYSMKWNAAVIAPMVVVNFAKMSSSGNQSGLIARSAETGAELGMSVAHVQAFYTRATEFRNGMQMGGDQGGFTMNRGIESPLPFGKMVETASEDNSAVKGVFDALGKAAGLLNAGGAARSSKKAVAETTDAAYAEAAGDALKRMNSVFGAWLRKYPAQ